MKYLIILALLLSACAATEPKYSNQCPPGTYLELVTLEKTYGARCREGPPPVAPTWEEMNNDIIRRKAG